jgi:hypothetical protein
MTEFQQQLLDTAESMCAAAAHGQYDKEAEVKFCALVERAVEQGKCCTYMIEREETRQKMQKLNEKYKVGKRND